jgi:HEAT repeat protein
MNLFLMRTKFNLSRIVFVVAVWLCIGASGIAQQTGDRLTPIQREIEHQRQRLNSADIEERRDALMRLGNLRRPDASRAAASALADAAAIVRVAAAHAVGSLPSSEATTLLIPLLKDKDEFVRRETAYGLGEIKSKAAVAPLSELLLTDKEAGVRGAAAASLGEIRDETAVTALAQALSGGAKPGKKKSKAAENEFVMRAAARSLGQIRSRAGVPVLISTLENEANPPDVRREAANALGAIGDPSAAAALRAASGSKDPSIAQAAWSASRKLNSKN